MRVVGSLTTAPGQYDKLLVTLKSLSRQTKKLDCVYVTFPRHNSKYDKSYHKLPEKVLEKCTIIRTEKDYGSCNKLVGPLASESNSDTVILTFESGIVYPLNLVEKMMDKHEEFPNSALGSNGLLMKYKFPFYGSVSNDKSRKVDAIYDFSCALYVRNFFFDPKDVFENLLKHTLNNKRFYDNGDLIISAYLSSKNIDRRVVDEIPQVEYDLSLIDQVNSIADFKETVEDLRNLGLFTDLQNVPISETWGGKGFVIIIFVILFLLGFAGFIIQT